MRIFPREKGKMAFVEGFSFKRPFSLSRVGKIASQGVENRGSLISVPLALRVGYNDMKIPISLQGTTGKKGIFWLEPPFPGGWEVGVCRPPGPLFPILGIMTLVHLVALYRAMRVRFGYGFESCDANGPRNVKNTNVAKHRPIVLPPLLLVGSKASVLKVPKRGQFHAAIRVTSQVALGRRTVSRRNFSREKVYTPPPPPPISGQMAFSSGGGWGCMF